jgi:hypothetical protein|tara:strand:- start:24 stop:1457 length:1434 start_codon:yes stop_codon:yes gene_type:complete
MAITADAQWWIRTDGNDLNGAGFDSTIGGYGTNYSDQAAAQLTLTDLATSGAGSTTLTSSTGGFTSAMVGNAIQIVSGTNVTNGYYFVTGYTSSNSVTVDRAPDNGGGGISSGNGKLGGAWASPEFVIGTAATTTPSPLVAGNTVNIRGSGTDNPSSPDYTFSTYRQLTSGTTNNYIKFVGYNGRPHIRGAHNLIIYNTTDHWYSNLKFSAGSSSFANNYGHVQDCIITNCVFDQNGYGGIGAQPRYAYNNYFYDSGSSSGATDYPAIRMKAYNYGCFGNFINTYGGGIDLTSGNINVCRNNVIVGNGAGYGVRFGGNTASFRFNIYNNTILNHAYGVESTHVTQTDSAEDISGNLIANCGVGIYFPSTLDDLNVPGSYHKNGFYNNTANYQNWSGRSSDVILTADPFTDASAGDYSLNTTAGGGAACRGAINPFEFTPIVSPVGYGDIGALQSDPTGAGGGSSYTNVAAAKFTRLE